jgi:hypothetical protein
MNKIKFHINDRIYIKKYKGNYLTPDTNNTYIISYIITKLINNNISGSYEKYAILNNGNDQLLFSYSSFTKNYEYYVEHVPWYHTIFCCF